MPETPNMARIIHFLTHLFREMVEAATLADDELYHDAVEHFTSLLEELTEEVRARAEKADEEAAHDE
jgi:hypothetical protein